jgi:hypothetical protein
MIFKEEVTEEQWAEWRAKWQADKVRWEKLHIPGKQYDTKKTSDTTGK